MKHSLLFSLFIAIGCLSYAQLKPAEAVALMGMGTNLGNTFEPPLEGTWNNPVAEDYYIDDIAAAGFKTLRIPIRWANHTATTAPFKIEDEWMKRMEHFVDMALAKGIFVIINAHHEDWFKVDYINQRPRLEAMWSQIAERFKGKSEKLFFELINEPRTHDHNGLTQNEINELNSRLISQIRTNNPTRILIYSGVGWTSAWDMMSAAIPNDEYMMAYYHSYTPWSFAGEGKGTWGSQSDINNLNNEFNSVK